MIRLLSLCTIAKWPSRSSFKSPNRRFKPSYSKQGFNQTQGPLRLTLCSEFSDCLVALTVNFYVPYQCDPRIHQ